MKNWENLKKDTLFQQKIVEVTDNMNFVEGDWDTVNFNFNREAIELDVEKTEEGLKILPSVLGEALIDLDPLLISKSLAHTLKVKKNKMAA